MSCGEKMTQTKPIAITILLAVLLPLLSSFTASAQPSATFYFYTPEGLKPGSKILVHAELVQTLDTKLSVVFARIVSMPIFIETADDAQIVELLLLNETKNSLSLYVDALRQYAYNKVIIQPTDTYGFVIKPAIRGHGVYSENITFTIPQTARCGDTLFLYFHIVTDDHDYDILRPIGVVCDAFRIGVYTEKQIADLLNKYQAVLKENTELRDQIDDQTRMLSKCSSEKTYLNNTLQEKEKEISTLTSQVGELQRQLNQQMSQNETLTILLAFTFVTTIMITIYLAKRLKEMKKTPQ
jgi:hypothetical protein